MKAAGRILLVLGIKRFRGGPKVSATAAGSPVPLSLRDVLKISGFKRLWLAQLVSILGDFLAVFGVINLMTIKWHGTLLQVTNTMMLIQQKKPTDSRQLLSSCTNHTNLKT